MMPIFLGILALLGGFLLLGGLKGVAYLAGKYAWLWFERFRIDPKHPLENPWGFLEGLDDNRVIEATSGGRSGKLLYIVYRNSTFRFTFRAIKDGRTPDPTNRSDFDVIDVPEGETLPEEVYDLGSGIFIDAFEVFRKQLRRSVDYDLVTFRFPWQKSPFIKPRTVPFYRILEERVPWGTGRRPIIQKEVTDHSRIRGDMQVATNGFPTKGDNINLVSEFTVFYRNLNPTGTRGWSDPFMFVFDVINTAMRAWLGQRATLEALSVLTKDGERGRVELEEHVADALKNLPMVPMIGERDPQPLARAFHWEITGVAFSDFTVASQRDAEALAELLTKPAATRSQGAATADARKALNLADIEPLSGLTPAHARDVVRLAAARSAKEIRYIEGVSPGDAQLGLQAETAENTRQET